MKKNWIMTQNMQDIDLIIFDVPSNFNWMDIEKILKESWDYEVPSWSQWFTSGKLSGSLKYQYYNYRSKIPRCSWKELNEPGEYRPWGDWGDY